MFEVEFFTEGNRTPVLEFILRQSKKEQAKILREIELLEEFGYNLGMPHTRNVKGYDDLWELRIQHGSNYFRLLYFPPAGKKYVLLHGIRKTDRKIPKKELEIACSRMKRYRKRGV